MYQPRSINQNIISNNMSIVMVFSYIFFMAFSTFIMTGIFSYMDRIRIIDLINRKIDKIR